MFIYMIDQARECEWKDGCARSLVDMMQSSYARSRLKRIILSFSLLLLSFINETNVWNAYRSTREMHDGNARRPLKKIKHTLRRRLSHLFPFTVEIMSGVCVCRLEQTTRNRSESFETTTTTTSTKQMKNLGSHIISSYQYGSEDDETNRNEKRKGQV